MRVQRLLLVSATTVLLSACSINQSPGGSGINPWAAPPTPTSFVPSVPTATAGPSISLLGGGSGTGAPGTGEEGSGSPPSFLSEEGQEATGGQNAGTEGSQRSAGDQVYTVQRGTVIDEILLNGRIALKQQSLAFTQDGNLATLHVQPALEVEEGQLLAELDIGNLEEQLRQAQVTYEQDQLSLQRSIQTAQLAVQRAQIDLDTAQARLNQLREPVSRDVVELARSEVRQAQANLELIRNNASAEKNQAKKSLDAAVSALIYAQQKFGEAKLELDQAMGGLNEDAAYAKFEGTAVDLRTAEENVAKAQIVYDTAVGNEIAVIKNAEALVDLAQARLDKVLLGPDKYELDAAQREVARARVAVQEAQQRAQPDTEMTKRVADSEFQVKQLQDQITARRLYAPFSGVIGSINVSTGFPVRAGSVVLTIVDPSQTEILTDNITGRDVTRVNAAKLSVGQEVEVSFSRYPDRTFAGTITEVPNRLADGSASGEATYHISYPSRGAVLDIGDLAALKITLGRKYNTLWLPPAAVRLTETPFVFVKDGDGERRVNIQVGIVSPDRVEILSGLNENDVVLGQ